MLKEQQIKIYPAAYTETSPAWECYCVDAKKKIQLISDKQHEIGVSNHFYMFQFSTVV